MRKFLTVVAFALVTIGFFAGFSNFGIPQIEPAPPPKEEVIDTSAMTMDQFIALGEKIVSGKGTCRLCHNPVGKRAPLLEEIGKHAPERLADARYEGEAKDIEGYIVESMEKPSAYVVKGYGKSGTNDTESPMPVVTGGSIGLNETEVAAVVAYLQDQGGVEVTVSIPTDAGEAAATAEPATGEPREAMTEPADIIAELACDACHMIRGEGGDVGPDLSAVGARADKAYIRQSILDPNAVIAEGFEPDMMPPGMGEQIYASELEVLVNFLADSK